VVHLWVESIFEFFGIAVIALLMVAMKLAYFLITTFSHLKAAEIKDGESVWERLGVEL